MPEDELLDDVISTNEGEKNTKIEKYSKFVPICSKNACKMLH
jgi:hypothetical protein